MSTYIINTEPECSAAADADEMLIYDASTGSTKKIGVDTLRSYMASGVVDVTTSTVSLTQASHGGQTVTLSRAAGVTVTLPAAAGTGAVYTVIVNTAVTSNADIIQVANATDEFVGVVYQVDTDTGDALVAYPSLDGDGYDTITMDGSTTGGLQGDRYVITDIASGKFQLIGHQNATGTVATPLSAAVA